MFFCFINLGKLYVAVIAAAAAAGSGSGSGVGVAQKYQTLQALGVFPSCWRRRFLSPTRLNLFSANLSTHFSIDYSYLASLPCCLCPFKTRFKGRCGLRQGHSACKCCRLLPCWAWCLSLVCFVQSQSCSAWRKRPLSNWSLQWWHLQVHGCAGWASLERRRKANKRLIWILLNRLRLLFLFYGLIMKSWMLARQILGLASISINA